MSERWHFREGWGMFFLTFAMVMATSMAVAAAGWTSGLDVVPLAGLGAFVIAFMIAKSLLPEWLGHLFSSVIGFAWSFRLVTNVFWLDSPWAQRWAKLWTDLYQWTYKLFTGGVNTNNIVFVLQMALIVWVTTHLTVWFIFRARKVWFSIIPGGILLLVNLHYAPEDISVYFVTYLILALLLVIRFNVFSQEQVWRREQVHFNANEISFDFLRAGTIFIVMIVALAWITPSAAVAEGADVFDIVRGPWRDMQQQWSRLFASLNYRSSGAADFYRKSLELGGPRSLAETPILEVDAPSNARYWRAIVFDRFTGRSWQNTDVNALPFGDKNQIPPLVNYQLRRPITHTVTALQPGISTLVMAAQPVWVSRPTRANLSYVNVAPRGNVEAETGELQVETVSFARSRGPLDPGEQYTVHALLNGASERHLREASDEYPEWVTSRYLQLPDTIPDRVKQLAQEIAAPYENAYDKATAIETYLREEIEYNEKIEAPPLNRDPVDYILFDLKEGYCDYYATSMAVMLRSLGIPARVASGYAQGEFDPDRGLYVVLQQDAHTWVEVFFPNYGWVEFEPTAAQPSIVRPIDFESLTRDQSASDEAASPPDRRDNLDDVEGADLPPESDVGLVPFWSRLSLNKPQSWIWSLLLLLVIGGATFWWLRNRRMPQRAAYIESIYGHMLRLSRWGGVSTYDSQTPLEQASTLSHAVPEAKRPATSIARLYARERYSHKPIGARERGEATSSWNRLRPLLRRAILRHWLRLRGRGS